MHAKGITATAIAALAVCAGAVGCSPASLRIEGGDAALPAGEGSAAFLDRVASQPTVSENDTLRGLLLLDGEDKTKTFGQRVEALADRGIIPRRWSYRATRPLTKGRLSYMIYQRCKLRGGVILTLTGPSQRYCLRELQYQGMMSAGSAGAKVTGMELVAVLSRADTYLRTGAVPGIMSTREGL